MKYFSIDLETTGLNGGVHGVTEFAAVFGDTLDTKLCKSFYRWLDPEGYVWSNFCLRLHAKWIEKATTRIFNKQFEAVADEPKICRNLVDVYADFYDWLMAIGECATDSPRILPTGKNFASFDKNFLIGRGFTNIFRHRTLDWVPFYTSSKDVVPPELELCKRRAIEAGCKRFSLSKVKHNALDDALDVHHLIQFAMNEADIEKLRKANEYIPQVERR
jgi:DNA polymerase III epsilon subunit-like protein